MHLPLERALRMPAFTRSTISERSSSATVPRTVKTILPAGVEVSICSENETKSIPNALRLTDPIFCDSPLAGSTIPALLPRGQLACDR
jgi:hypothetical protein